MILQNPHIRIPIWQDTHVYETQISGITALQKVYDVYVVYKQGSTGLGCDTRFIEKELMYIWDICCVNMVR